MNLYVPNDDPLKRPAQDANPCPLQRDDGSLACEGLAQSHLHQFMISLWLHFFRRHGDDPEASWRECGSRRRRHFVDAPREQIEAFASYVAAHGPECQRPHLAAILNSRLDGREKPWTD